MISVKNWIYDSIEAFENNFKIDKELDEKKYFIQVFTGFCKYKEIEKISSKLNSLGVDYVGTTTSGAIVLDEIIHQKLVLVLFEFEYSQIKIVEKDVGVERQFESGKIFAIENFLEDDKVALLYSSGLDFNTENFLDGITTENKKIVIAGGRAADNALLNETFIFSSKKIYRRGVIAVVISGTKLFLESGHNLNWVPIGQEMVVTKVNGGVLEELDGISVIDVYKKYLGERASSLLPATGVEFPLLENEGGLEICRTVVAREGEKLILTGDLKIGDKVRFSIVNGSFSLAKSVETIKKNTRYKNDVTFVYSCTARLSYFKEDIIREIIPLNEYSKAFGFFTYGEFYHNKEKNYLLANTLTYLKMYEGDEREQLEFEKVILEKDTQEDSGNFFLVKDTMKLEAVINLTKIIIEDLKSVKDELEELSNKDHLTEVYNRRYIEKKFVEITNESTCKNLGVIMLDIDNFKRINDEYGHDIGDLVLKKLSYVLKETVRSNDLVARIGGEEFLIILLDVTDESLNKVGEKIRENVAGCEVVLKNESLKFTISLGGVCSNCKEEYEKMYKKADQSLYKAKKTGKNKFVLFKD